MADSSSMQRTGSFTGPFDWPLCYEAEQLVSGYIRDFLERNNFARGLAERMREETGTRCFDWVDHVVLRPGHEEELRAAGLVEEEFDAPAGTRVFWHPRAMIPRVLLAPGGENRDAQSLALRVESLVDFVAAHDLDVEVEGAFGARLRWALIARESGSSLLAVERLGYCGHMVREPTAEFASDVLRVREGWRTRKRDFPDERAGIRHAFARLDAALERVDRDAACDLFFAEERMFWEKRNRAAQIQKRRQDRLGLGWANHDHHTFRSSRENFAEVMRFFARLGFRKRERYYAGAEAGWGAQILEQPVAGIVVFADLDLLPEETEIDFSVHRLPPSPQVRTVGLWCGLHGDSFFQAGMHHLEARFDFTQLREQLAQQGVNTMKPFSDFEFLRQAFTEGERWRVKPERVAALRTRGMITSEQADAFLRDGAIGSHLENLQRKGGFKGFNQKSVSAIIAATDPRQVQEASALRS
jgi:hypothetical protein